jgi:pimeloyl-ACP methyl ester carboxylesterase
LGRRRAVGAEPHTRQEPQRTAKRAEEVSSRRGLGQPKGVVARDEAAIPERQARMAELDKTSDRLQWKTVSVNGRTAAYGEAGDGDPLVFLHGWGLGQHAYKRAMRRLVRLGVRVIAPALPGFGGTADLPPEDFSIEGYGDWVAAFLDALRVDEPCIVVGHSFGGGVATAFAHRHTDRVRLLVLVNSIGGSVWAKKGSAVKAMAERPLWDWGLHFPADVMPIRQVRRVLPVILEDALPNVLRNPRSLWKVANLARTADLRPHLADLREKGVPIIILWGKEDRIITEESFKDLCLAAGTEGDLIPGNHSWLLADPDAFGEVMTNVIAVARMANKMRRNKADSRRDSEPVSKAATEKPS